MKAWDQISSNDENRVFRTMNSSWYIDYGVKIECFDNDGRVEVMNTMTTSDFHEPITDEQRYFFDNIGWEAGCYKVNVDSCEKKLKYLNHLLFLSEQSPDIYDADYINQRISKMLVKKDQYTRKLEKILKTL